MYDAGRILIGLGLFVALFAYPFYNNLGQAYEEPKLQKVAKDKGEVCIEDAKWMRANHMQVLNDWRNEVVRYGNRLYTSSLNGKTYEMSLQNTCMSCHVSKVEFCDKCHNNATVNPYCWDCHVPPKEQPAAASAENAQPAQEKAHE